MRRVSAHKDFSSQRTKNGAPLLFVSFAGRSKSESILATVYTSAAKRHTIVSTSQRE